MQTFDDDLGLSQDGHEIRVSVPARDDVPVKMPWQTGACGVALVKADVVALRLHIRSRMASILRIVSIGSSKSGPASSPSVPRCK